MWPFEPRGRRQVYESGGSDGVGGDAGGGGGGFGGYSVGQGEGYSGNVESGADTAGAGGTGPGAQTGGGEYDASQGGGYSGTTGAGTPDTSGTSGIGSSGGGWGAGGPPAASGGAPAPGGTPGETGVPGGVAPAGSAPQPGLDTPDTNLAGIGAYVDNPATSVTREGALESPPGFESTYGVNYTGEPITGGPFSFSDITEQFGPNITGDPFATSDDERSRGGAPPPNDEVSDAFTGTPVNSQVAQALAAPAPTAEPPGGIVLGGRISQDTPAPAIDVPAIGSTPGSPAPSTGPAAASGTPNASPGSAPDVSAAGGATADPLAGLPPLPYTDAERAASAPSTEQFSPAPNRMTAAMQALFGVAGAAIGGPVAGFLNQNLASTLGGVGAVPGVSEIASVLGTAQTVGGMTGATEGRAGSPSERAQPNIASMLWDDIHGRPSRSRGISPIGNMQRPSVMSYLFNRDNRTRVGENPAPDPRTYDPRQLVGVGSARGTAGTLTPQEQVAAMMVPQDFDLTGGNQAGDNRVVDMLLAALGLDPTGDQTTPTTGPTEGQLPSTFPGYFAGGQSDLNPLIPGQRTAFDPRSFA